MAKFLKSGDPITPSSIDLLQNDVASSANSIGPEDIARGAIGSEHMQDSVLYCARNFTCNFDQIAADPVRFPETINGPHWEAPVDADTPGKSWIWHRKERERWGTLRGYSSHAHASTSESIDNNISTLTNITSPVGDRMFRIPNKGNGYSLFFFDNIRVSRARNLTTEDEPGLLHPWLNGQRFWTAVVYYFKPNLNSKKILSWSPGHMLGASASPSNISRKFYNIEINHSYQDTIFINQSFIQALADGYGYDVDTEKLTLGDTSLFGWKTVIGMDRWDGVRSDDGMMGHKKSVDTDGDGVTDSEGYSYYNGQPVVVKEGNVGFIAFKYDSGTSESLLQSF